MNATAETCRSNVYLPPGAAGWCQRAVLTALSRLPRGRLTLQLPDGRTLAFGEGDAGAAAASVRAEIVVRRPSFFRRCVLFGDIGFAEAYVDGDWDTPDITAVISWFVLNHDSAPTLSGAAATAGLNVARTVNRWLHRARPNSRATAARNIRDHYDLSNAFFQLWLDPTMMYSSARWRTANSLAAAQREKNDGLCERLRLTPHDHVLEIGSGWGGWAIHAAGGYGCRVTSLTLSRQQYELARERVAAAGLSSRVEIRLQDYRALPAGEVYDKLVSIEMLEAVGHRYLPDWCRVAARALKPEGVMALQFITCPDSRYEALRRGVDFIQKHIFPGSLLLSQNRVSSLLAQKGGFVLRELEDIGLDYARTLQVWRTRFNEREREIGALGFDGRFRRKWNYYLAYCEAAFARRNISAVQAVYSRPNHLAR